MFVTIAALLGVVPACGKPWSQAPSLVVDHLACRCCDDRKPSSGTVIEPGGLGATMAANATAKSA